MPEYLAPGVYIEETSFRAKSIEGVSTTTTGFIGPTRYGPLDLEPDVITSLGEFERVYGDRVQLQFSDTGALHNYMWHAARAFFEEGGKRLYIARVFTPKSDTDAGIASAKIPADVAAAPGAAAGAPPETRFPKAVHLRARFPGAAGNVNVRFGLRIGQNILRQDDQGKPVLSAALLNGDVVWIGKRTPPTPGGAVPPAPPALPTTFADPDAQALFDNLKALLGPAPSPAARIEQARRLAARVVEAAQAEATNSEASAVRLEAAAASMRSAFNAKTQEALRLGVAADAAEQAADDALADFLMAQSVQADVEADATASNDQKTAAIALRDSAKARSDAARAAATQARTAATTAQGEANTLKNNLEDPATGAVKLATDARTAANAARAQAEQMAQATQSALPVPAAQPAAEPGPAGLGKLFLASLDPGTSTFKFTDSAAGTPRPASDLKPSQGEEVAIVTLAVTVTLQNGSTLVWDNAALQPGHVRAGANDSLDALLSPKPANLGQARTLPIVLTLGDDLKDGLLVAQALFAGIASIGANTDVPLKNEFVTADFRLAGGNDGKRPESDEYEGVEGPQSKTGLKAFEDIEDISIIAAPGSTYGMDNGYAADARTIMQGLISHAERMRYRIAVLDSGDGQSIAAVRALRGRVDSKYAALYYPWVRVLDPVTRQEIYLPPSGFVAGIYARNDISRAVWKAPANEVVNSALGFEILLNKSQQDVLNPEGINCFRFFEGRGFRLWGARTISSDPEWKYVNLRRYFIYLERSIDRGTQWAVFEPNGEALWANVRRTIEDFLFNEWSMGALLGDKPEKAYFVKCDRSTMTQNDLDNGRLVCLIGVAPLRPAEFVIFRIGQWTGDRRP